MVRSYQWYLAVDYAGLYTAITILFNVTQVTDMSGK